MSPLSRRRLCRSAGAVAVAASGSLFAACARGAQGQSAAPQAAAPVLTIRFSPWTEGNQWTSTITTVLGEAMAPFEAQNKGIRVQIVPPPGGCCNAAQLAVDMVAGTAPDIVVGNHFGGFASGGYFLPLDPYLQRDNVSVGLWSKRQMQSFQGWNPASVLALPVYFNTTAYMVNLSALDAAGLAYPDPNWTHTEFAALAAKAGAPRANPPRFGCNLWFWTAQAWGSDWIFHAFSGAKVAPNGTTCVLDQTPAQDAAKWIYEDIIWPKVGTMQNTFGGYNQQFATGRTVFSAQQTGTLLAGIVSLAKTSIKWQIYPFPIFPAGRTAFGGDQFYAINSLSKHPDQAWELLKWVAAGTQWQRAMIKLFLMAPALNSLWPEWESLVRAVAPPLHGKAVQWFSDPAVNGYAYPTAYFRYADSQAEGIIQTYFSGLYAQKYDVPTALRQAADQVNALEATTAAAAVSTLGAQRAASQQQHQGLQRMFAAGRAAAG